MFFLILPYGSCPICINRHFRVIKLDYQPLAVRENELALDRTRKTVEIEPTRNVIENNLNDSSLSSQAKMCFSLVPNGPRQVRITGDVTGHARREEWRGEVWHHVTTAAKFLDLNNFSLLFALSNNGRKVCAGKALLLKKGRLIFRLTN